MHLLQRVYGSMIAAAPDIEAARAVVDRAEATLSTEDECHFCTIMLDLPRRGRASTPVSMGLAAKYLASAETSAQLWEGTSWQAALLEVRAHLARAEARTDDGKADAHRRGEPLRGCRTAAGRRTLPVGGRHRGLIRQTRAHFPLPLKDCQRSGGCGEPISIACASDDGLGGAAGVGRGLSRWWAWGSAGGSVWASGVRSKL